jgi:hypothetical protein
VLVHHPPPHAAKEDNMDNSTQNSKPPVSAANGTAGNGLLSPRDDYYIRLEVLKLAHSRHAWGQAPHSTTAATKVVEDANVYFAFVTNSAAQEQGR